MYKRQVSVSFDSHNRRLIRNFLAGSVLLCPVESSNRMKSDHGRTGFGADLLERGIYERKI